MAQWVPSGAVGGSGHPRLRRDRWRRRRVRLDPPTIYPARVVDLVLKDPGAEHFYLVHSTATSRRDRSEAEADCWAARELAKARNGERYLNAAIRHFMRRPNEPSARYGSPSERAERIRYCAET